MKDRTFLARSALDVVLALSLVGIIAGCYPYMYSSARRYCTVFVRCDPIPDSAYVRHAGVNWDSKEQALKFWAPTASSYPRLWQDLDYLVLSKQSYVTDSFYLGTIFFDPKNDKDDWKVYNWADGSWHEMTDRVQWWGPDGNGYLECKYQFKEELRLKRDVRRLYFTVNTEPSGCRVYSNGRLIGTTPATMNYVLSDSDYQLGYLLRDTLTVVSDGYLAKSTVPRFPLTDAEQRSREDIHEYQLVVLERDLHAPTQILVQPTYAQPSSQQYDATRARAYEAAKAEYEQALASWEAAMRDCDNIGLNSQAINNAATGSNWAGFLDNLGSLAKQDAARKVQVAKERLERAKAKLQALEWK
ncbi:MAG: hypothetical protein NTX53_05495 [candidate division WOR-3 bacterium]|nr:hypothetical protein [candidate division WOR-3 bacterium]